MALSDRPAERHRQVAGLFTDRVRGTRSWDAPSPVADWAARDVVRHLTDGFPGSSPPGRHRTAPRTVGGRGPGRRVAGSLRRRAGGAGRSGDGAPAAHQPARRQSAVEVAIDQFYTADVFMHTWDLARATGQDDRLDPDFCARLLGADGADGGRYPRLRPVRRPGRGTRRRGYPDQTAGFHRPGPVLVGAMSPGELHLFCRGPMRSVLLCEQYGTSEIERSSCTRYGA